MSALRLAVRHSGGCASWSFRAIVVFDPAVGTGKLLEDRWTHGALTPCGGAERASQAEMAWTESPEGDVGCPVPNVSAAMR